MAFPFLTAASPKVPKASQRFAFPDSSIPSLGGSRDQILKVEAEPLNLKAGGSLCKNANKMLKKYAIATS